MSPIQQINQDRALPASLEAERLVLGAALSDPEAFPRMLPLLEAGDFSLEKHVRIFRCMTELFDAARPLSPVSVGEELKKRGELKSIDGLSYLLSLAADVPTLEMLERYCEIVKDNSNRRRAITAMYASIDRCYAGGVELEPAIPVKRSREKPPEMAEAALHGIAGEFVRLIMPHTESGLPAVLLQFLVTAGSYVGRSGYYRAEGDRHHTNLFTVIVGGTSKGRKGTSWGQINRLFMMVDADFTKRIQSGISTGEGIIWAVRDEIREDQPIREKGRVTVYEEVIIDKGVLDKRLLAQEPEFARVLKSIERDSNTASAIIRAAWDSGTLDILTKTKKARATNAHVAIIGHITSDELKKLLTNTEAANGFANRFLWVYTERSKELPFGGNVTDEGLEVIAKRLRDVYAHAATAGRITFDEEAAEGWQRVYGQLSGGKPGLLGAVIGRAEAQVVRLATLYALLDCDEKIRQHHLQAALAVWDYCEASASFIFGDSLGDDTADSILAHLNSVGKSGATRNEIRELFQRNKNSSEIARALDVLARTGAASFSREDQAHGRPIERWFGRDHNLSSGYALNAINAVSPPNHLLNAYTAFNAYHEGETA